MKKRRVTSVLVRIVLCLNLSLIGCGYDVTSDALEQIFASVDMVENTLSEKESSNPADNIDFNPAENNYFHQENSFLLVNACDFAYEHLTESEKKWYRQMAECMGDMKGSIELDSEAFQDGLTEEDVDLVFQSVMLDHPELFFVEGYSYTVYTRGKELVGIDFEGNYSCGRELALVRKKEIEKAATSILEEAQKYSSDFDRIKFVYDKIIQNTDYVIDAPDNQNIYSVFVNHASVCQGYASATQYLLNRMGMECTLIQGTVEDNDAHAWNLVKADGAYYYLDTTWGDAFYDLEQTNEEGAYLPGVNYDYMCITTERLLRTHKPDMPFPLPDCTETQDNYYVHEGAFFQQYDEEQLRKLFENDTGGNFAISLQCSDIGCYDEMISRLVDQQEIFLYLPQDTSDVTYAINTKQLSMSFWMTNE